MTIVVTGATGNVGEKVRAVSRQPNQAALPAAVAVVESATAATTFAQWVSAHRHLFTQ